MPKNSSTATSRPRLTGPEAEQLADLALDRSDLVLGRTLTLDHPGAAVVPQYVQGHRRPAHAVGLVPAHLRPQGIGAQLAGGDAVDGYADGPRLPFQPRQVRVNDRGLPSGVREDRAVQPFDLTPDGH